MSDIKITRSFVSRQVVRIGAGLLGAIGRLKSESDRSIIQTFGVRVSSLKLPCPAHIPCYIDLPRVVPGFTVGKVESNGAEVRIFSRRIQEIWLAVDNRRN